MSFPKASYFVKNGNTLGFIYTEQPHFFNVLQGNPVAGGAGWKDGFVALSASDVLVPATIADFNKFRVCPKGHIA